MNLIDLLYFMGYKTKIFPFQFYPKDLDPSCKMDLDLWDCFGWGKPTVVVVLFYVRGKQLWSCREGQ